MLFIMRLLCKRCPYGYAYDLGGVHHSAVLDLSTACHQYIVANLAMPSVHMT